MDGDASGSLCPIASVSKEFLLEWLAHIQSGKNPWISPKESIQLLLATKPTAELRPLAENQEDEKDLMPYPLLQKIEKYLIYAGLHPDTVLELLKKDLPESSEESLKNSIRKFQAYFGRSQWKRERLAPSFHLDEYSLDPKSYFRFPILSGF